MDVPNLDGMVACSPPRCEAAHRAQVDGIATKDHAGRELREVLIQTENRGTNVSWGEIG